LDYWKRRLGGWPVGKNCTGTERRLWLLDELDEHAPNGYGLRWTSFEAWARTRFELYEPI
jgi:hypothetical protein